MLIGVRANRDRHINGDILLAARNTLLYETAVQLFALEIREEETRYFGHSLVWFHLPDHRRRHTAVPHEQRQVLKGAGFRAQRLLQPHRPMAQDTKKGWSGLPRGHLDTISTIHQTF